MAAKSICLSHLFLFCLLFNFVKIAQSWDQIDLELFDLVEELKENFYKILGVEQSASVAEIRRAYRKLSLLLHPDRNKEPDAEVKFRQLVAAAEVLRDEEKRKRYDAILRDGLPDWRQPVFYYRRVRKMGIIEFFILLFIITTIGHFIVIWSMYLEKKFEMEELLSSKMKREEKKKRKAKAEFTEDNINEIADALVHETGYKRPTFFDLLPFKIWNSTIAFFVSLPGRYRTYQAYKEEMARQKLEEEQQQLEEEAEEEQPKPRRRQRVTFPEELPEDEDSSWAVAPVTNMIAPKTDDNDDNDDEYKSEEWTDEDFSRLSRAMVKFPGGTPKRWVKIAQEMGKSVEMVTKQMKKIRQAQGVANPVGPGGPGGPGKLVTSRKVATVKEDILTRADPGCEQQNETEDNQEPSNNTTTTVTWTQNQQKLLEIALQQYPKTTPDRWTCIARCVPGMTKEDCIARYKTLVELMRQKKAQEPKQ